MDAFAIGTLSTKNEFYLDQGLACANSIRESGCSKDVVFVTVEMSEEHEKTIVAAGYKVFRFDPINHLALNL